VLLHLLQGEPINENEKMARMSRSINPTYLLTVRQGAEKEAEAATLTARNTS
jgi:hypothetical protein